MATQRRTQHHNPKHRMQHNLVLQNVLGGKHVSHIVHHSLRSQEHDRWENIRPNFARDLAIREDRHQYKQHPQ
eukprot:5291551-Prorocentrum_lima.AAC.1